MNVRRVILAATTALALAACSSDPAAGRVTEKRYEEAYTAAVQICNVYGKYGCQSWMSVPYTSGPFWVLTLTDGEQTWEVTTTEQRYEHTNVGDTVKTEDAP